MASKIPMAFKKGDQQTHYFQMESDDWSAGGTLWFAAKALVDNDTTDGAAVINKSFDDTCIVTDPTNENYATGFVTYELEFTPSDIVGVTYTDGQKVKKYLGEFQYVDVDGEPQSFPNDDSFIEVSIYADIKRGTS
jgi:hypothetical protein